MLTLMTLSQLEDFKKFLDHLGVAYREGKGTYEVLQVHSDGWRPIHRKDGKSRLVASNEDLLGLIKRFLADELEGDVKAFNKVHPPEKKVDKQLLDVATQLMAGRMANENSGYASHDPDAQAIQRIFWIAEQLVNGAKR